MLRRGGRSLLRQSLRFQSTESGATTSEVASVLPNAALPPKFVLTTVRAFPSLEPLSFSPIPSFVLNNPLRRDLLWKAVVYENDNKRVGSSNPPGRSENGYSRRKLAPQKGTGRARVGDANSPTRHNGARALARTAPNDYTTKLPAKVYSQAFLNALSYQYKQGNLFIIGGENPLSDINESDLNELELVSSNLETDDSVHIFERFLQEYKLNGKNLLFVTDQPKLGLMDATESHKNNVDIVQKEVVDVNDILKSSKIFMDINALAYLAVTHSTQ